MVTRPVLRYHGGKWRLAPWIIGHFPPHRIFTETFGGGASVLLRKPRVYSEVYNDLDGEICALFRVLRSPAEARELMRQLELTPYARDEFELAQLPAGDPIEVARRLIIRSFMGFGSGSATSNSGFRWGIRRSGSAASGDWMRYPDALAAVTSRLRSVTIENLPAARVLAGYDSPQTLHYVDPPYPASTRNIHSSSNCIYRHEMSDDEHRELAGVLHGLAGFVIISGYRCPLYDDLYADWTRVDMKARADGNAPRIESLWLSPNVISQPTLFSQEHQP